MKKTTVISTCDGCGETENNELKVTPHILAFDNTEYDIDLCDLCLTDEIKYYKIRGNNQRRISRKGTPRQRTAASRRRAAEMRKWLRNHGWEIPDRGRIPTEAVNTYNNRAV